MPTIDPTESFNQLKTRTEKEIGDFFPHKGRTHTIEAEKVWVDDNKDLDDIDDQLKTKLKGRTWSVPVKAKMTLRDNNTGKVVDSRTMTISALPKITNRYSYVLKGNEYQVDNLFRLKYGIYPRVKSNGDISAQVNISKPVGSNIDFNPEKRAFTFRYRDTKVPLHHVLGIMGTKDEDIKKSWGSAVYKANSEAKIGRDQTVKLLHKAVFGRAAAGMDETTAEDDLRKFFKEEAKVDPEATKAALGVETDHLSGPALLATGSRLLGISRGTEEPVDRDSLEFKDLLSTEDFIAERLKNSAKTITRKLNNNVDRKTDLRQIINPQIFRTPVESFFSSSNLSNTTDQTNPMDMLSGQLRTTIIAPNEGGIKDERVITDEATFINPSTLGFLDPIATPESRRTGLTPPTIGCSEEWNNPKDQGFRC